MVAPTDHVARLLAEVGHVLGVEPREVQLPDCDDSRWSELTGFADRPPEPAAPGPPALTRAALGIVRAYLGADVPGLEVLTERAELAGYTRNAPFSPGGVFRMLPAKDGWFGISLSRSADLDRLPALIQAHLDGEPWAALAAWLASVTVAEAAARTQLLGLPAAPVPSAPAPVRRPSVLVTLGGARTRQARPLVVDLTSLWAGPLCARLLRLGGARVVKVESRQRPDGARAGSPAFFDLMHTGAQFRTLDFATERDQLRALVRSADVVLEGSRPRALRQLGIDACEQVERGGIWASLTAYGRGPGDDMRVGFGDDVAAGAGLVNWVNGSPIPTGDAVADPLTGVTAAAAVAIALHAERGTLLDVSMHDVARHAVVDVDGKRTR